MGCVSEKLARAKQTYSDALVALNEAKEEFKSGKGFAYEQFLKKKEDLESKISASSASEVELERRFQDAFRDAGYVNTKEVDEILTSKMKESSINSSLRMALEHLNEQSLDFETAASISAEKYRSLYLDAYKAWVRVQVYEHLAEHGKALGRILALAKHVGVAPISGPNGFRYYDMNQMERDSGDVAELRQAFVFDAIRECAASHHESESPTMPDEMGALDLGLFNTQATLTPAQICRNSREAAASKKVLAA